MFKYFRGRESLNRLSVFLFLTLILFGLSHQAYLAYELLHDKEFIVTLPENVSLNKNTDLKSEAAKVGEVIEKLPYLNGYRVLSDELRSKSFKLAQGVIIEPVLKYSKPRPIKKSMWLNFGCSQTPPPEPTPPPVLPPNPGSQVYDWGVRRVGGEKSENTEAVIVCVLDTGIDKTHPDLRYIAGRNFTTSNGEDFQDRDGHGSHTAGLVGAVDNALGVVGASQASLLIGKVLGDDGSGYNDWIASGINWCVGQDADIISMSLGGPQSSTVIYNALKNATSKGVWVFAAAGNDGTDQVGYPAGYRMENLFSISATDKYDRLAYFSNYGKVEYTCPGVDILSTVPGGYDTYSGTSMATPICAGVAAYYMSYGLSLKAVDMGDPTRFGKGMLTIE